MAVYVDPAIWPYGRMIMCHMVADTEQELHVMARKLGLKREWFQRKKYPHYDVCKAKRTKAVSLGAVEVTTRELIEICKRVKDGKKVSSGGKL